jgi:hypothetical protein
VRLYGEGRLLDKRPTESPNMHGPHPSQSSPRAFE